MSGRSCKLIDVSKREATLNAQPIEAYQTAVDLLVAQYYLVVGVPHCNFAPTMAKRLPQRHGYQHSAGQDLPHQVLVFVGSRLGNP
jgi:hypothetical protein